jgi:hypothetical protein
MPTQPLTASEIATRGQEIYEREIRAKVEDGNKGRFLVLDIDTGDYEIAEDDLTATHRLLARRPGAVTYGVRIGHRAAYRIGGHSLQQQS